MRAGLPLAACLALGACAPRPRAPAPAAGLPPESDFGALLTAGRADAADSLADRYLASARPADRESGRYWKALGKLARGDLAGARRGLAGAEGWAGPERRLQAAFLIGLMDEVDRLERAQDRARADSGRRQEELRNLRERLDALRREQAQLRAEVERLGAEKAKYEDLLKDLESVR